MITTSQLDQGVSLPNIHPTAIVDPQAQLANDAYIGPGCVISSRATIGPGCRLIGHVYLNGPVTLGQNNTLYPFVCIGFEPQDVKYDGTTAGVQLGDRNVLRESATIHCSTRADRPTTLGHDNFLMTYAHVGHDVVISNGCTLVTGAMLGGHAQVEDGVIFGGNGAIHQHCRAGRLSLIGGASTALKDVPPFTVCQELNRIIGVNLIGLRRNGVPREAIDQIKTAFQILYRSGHSNPVAADLIEELAAQQGPGADLLDEIVQFVRTSRRGLCPHALAVEHKRTSKH